MILSDSTIKSKVESGAIVIQPWDIHALQPASVDLRLFDTFLIPRTDSMTHLDPEDTDLLRYDRRRLELDEQFILHSNELVLASTVERVELPDYIMAQVNGKSSLGRLGLLIHATAGFIDPNFRGRITLELSNVASVPIVLRPNMKIAQISFMLLDKPCERGYGHPDLNSKYQDQITVTPSKYHLND